MTGLKIAIVASRFNAEITERLIAGAQEALRGLAEVSLFQVPGAFEIPLAAKQAALSKRFDAIVAIGCVIRGETVASTGIAQVSLETGVPVTFGVLTVDTDEQAMLRSVPGGDNKGYHAAQAAVEMVRILKKLA
jgi:6,7-dimethyl-8-ribityllumazine synthase